METRPPRLRSHHGRLGKGFAGDGTALLETAPGFPPRLDGDGARGNCELFILFIVQPSKKLQQK